MGAWEAEAVGWGGFRGRWLSGRPKPMGARGIDPLGPGAGAQLPTSPRVIAEATLSRRLEPEVEAVLG